MTKPEDEIQRAHDVLTACILGEVKIGLRPEDKKSMQVACDALCWVLNHDHNKTFANNLAMIMKKADELGYTLFEKKD